MKSSMIIACAIAVVVIASERESAAGPTAKDECLDAHSHGQDQRERGQLVRAKQTFLTCAQSSCPALVQGDCARFGEELAHLVPTISFGARDRAANDLPSTSVYVDDVLFTTRLDDGKSFEVDPGRHNVRYVHEGKESTLHVIVNQGEKSRLLVARFIDVDVPHRDGDPAIASSATVVGSRSKLPLVVAGGGLAAAATGALLFGIGMGNVPSNCSVSSHECVSPIGDPSLGKARDGIAMANIGAVVGSIGAVALIGGLVWYFVQPSEGARHLGRLSPSFSF